MLTTPTVEQGIEIGALGLGAALLGELYLLVLYYLANTYPTQLTKQHYDEVSFASLCLLINRLLNILFDKRTWPHVSY
jgi:hypothetical protein